jgi:predicted nucleic acid-binding protein
MARDALTVAWRSEPNGPRTAVLRAALDDEWSVHVTFVEEEGEPVVRSLLVSPQGETPRGGLTTTKLRNVALTSLLARARETLADHAPEAQHASAYLGAERKMGRPRTITDLFLAQLAVAYEEALKTHAAPRKAVAEQFGLSPERTRDYLKEASRRGLRTRGVHGRASGRATDRAKALLAEAEREKKPPRRGRGRGRGTQGGTSDAGPK